MAANPLLQGCSLQIYLVLISMKMYLTERGRLLGKA